MGKRGPQPTGKGITIGVRCQAGFLASLDAWRLAQPVAPARAAALRHLAEVALRSAGSRAARGRGARSSKRRPE